MNEKVLNYTKARKELLKEVGLSEDSSYTLKDVSHCFWTMNGEEEVIFHPNKEDVEDDTGEEMVEEIYHKNIFKGTDITIINVDYQREKSSLIFDNSKCLDNI